MEQLWSSSEVLRSSSGEFESEDPEDVIVLAGAGCGVGEQQ